MLSWGHCSQSNYAPTRTPLTLLSTIAVSAIQIKKQRFGVGTPLNLGKCNDLLIDGNIHEYVHVLHVAAVLLVMPCRM